MAKKMNVNIEQLIEDIEEGRVIYPIMSLDREINRNENIIKAALEKQYAGFKFGDSLNFEKLHIDYPTGMEIVFKTQCEILFNAMYDAFFHSKEANDIVINNGFRASGYIYEKIDYSARLSNSLRGLSPFGFKFGFMGFSEKLGVFLNKLVDKASSTIEVELAEQFIDNALAAAKTTQDELGFKMSDKYKNRVKANINSRIEQEL